MKKLGCSIMCLLAFGASTAYATSLIRIKCILRDDFYDEGNIFINDQLKGQCPQLDIQVPSGEHVVVVENIQKDGSAYVYRKTLTLADAVIQSLQAKLSLEYREAYFAIRSTTLEGVVEYHTRFPQGKLMDQVEENSWSLAQESFAAWKQHTDLFKSGRFKDNYQQTLLSLSKIDLQAFQFYFAQSDSKDQYLHEATLWDLSKYLDRPDLYLNEYPNGEYFEPARKRLVEVLNKPVFTADMRIKKQIYDFILPSTNFTVAFLFRSSDPNSGLFSAMGTPTGANGHDRDLYLKNGNICSRVWDSPYICSKDRNFADNQFHQVHYVLSEHDGQLIYVDGDLVARGDKNASDFKNNKVISLGFSPDASHSELMSEAGFLRIYPRIFKDAHIREYFSRMTTQDQSTIEDAHWRLWQGNEKTLLQYLSEYPSGKYVQQAEDYLWQNWKTSENGIQKYIATFPNGRYNTQTEDMLWNIWKESEGGRQKYRTAYPSGKFIPEVMKMKMKFLSEYKLFAPWKNQKQVLSFVLPPTNTTVAFKFRTRNRNVGLFSAMGSEDGEKGFDRDIYLRDGNICSRVWNNETICSTQSDLADGKIHQVHYVLSEHDGQSLYIDSKLVAKGYKGWSDFNLNLFVAVGFSRDAKVWNIDGEAGLLRIYSQAFDQNSVLLYMDWASKEDEEVK